MGAPLPKPHALFKTNSLAGRKILVAEDNDLNLEIAVEILSMAGAAVDCAHTGKEAVDWFQSSEAVSYTHL